MALILPTGIEVQGPEPIDNRIVKQTLQERDAIPNVLRYEGLSVYVIDEETEYQLRGGITNGDWESTSFVAWQSMTGGIFYEGGKVAIGQTSATGTLDVRSDNLVQNHSALTLRNNQGRAMVYFRQSVDGIGAALDLAINDTTETQQVNISANSPSWIAGGVLGLGKDNPDPTYALDVAGSVLISNGLEANTITQDGNPVWHSGNFDPDSKEDALGNPSTSGYVLSSDTAGVRSWVPQPTPISDVPSDGVLYGRIDAAWAPIADTHYTKGEHIAVSLGTADAGKPIILNPQGQIDTSMINASTFYYVGPFTPETANEYPDTTGESHGAFWVTQGLAATYTFQGGDLAGLNIDNGDFMVWGSVGWSIMRGEMNPLLYYKLDGSQAITAAFAGGGQQIKNIADGTDSTDAATVAQLDTKLELTGGTLTGGLTLTGTREGYLNITTPLMADAWPKLRFSNNDLSKWLDFEYNVSSHLWGVYLKDSTAGTEATQNSLIFSEDMVAIESNVSVTRDVVPTDDAHLTRKDYVDTGLATKEDQLGNPTTDGYVLSSTTTGVRSWIPISEQINIPDAPSDGVTYGRLNATWQKVVNAAGDEMSGDLTMMDSDVIFRKTDDIKTTLTQFYNAAGDRVGYFGNTSGNSTDFYMVSELGNVRVLTSNGDFLVNSSPVWTAATFDPATKADQSALDAHTGDTNNPHSVTATQVGADPAGSASAVQANLDTHTSDTSNPHSVTAEQAGAQAVSDITHHITQAGWIRIAKLTSSAGRGSYEISTKVQGGIIAEGALIYFEVNSYSVASNPSNVVVSNMSTYIQGVGLIDSDGDGKPWVCVKVAHDGTDYNMITRFKSLNTLGTFTPSTTTDAETLTMGNEYLFGTGNSFSGNILVKRDANGVGIDVRTLNSGDNYFTRYAMWGTNPAGENIEIGRLAAYQKDSGVNSDIYIYQRLADAMVKAITIYRDGNVGIYKDTPTEKLDVAGSVKANGSLKVNTTNQSAAVNYYDNDVIQWKTSMYDATRKDWGIARYDDAGSYVSYALAISRATGNVLIGGSGEASERLEVIGNVKATDFIPTSDARLKEDIRYEVPSTDGLKPATYVMKETGDLQYGFIAQDMLDTHPELVKGTGEEKDGEIDYYSIKLNSIVAMLVAEVQDLKKEVNELKQNKQ